MSEIAKMHSTGTKAREGTHGGERQDCILYADQVIRRGGQHKRQDKNRAEVSDMVRDADGTCNLYQTSGTMYDYVSVIKKIDAATAIKIAAKIEELQGFEVTMLAGLDTATK